MPTTAQEAIYTVLSTYAGLVALVSQRIYPNEAPQGEQIPLVVFNEIALDQGTSTHGEYGADPSMDGVTVQVDCIAATPLEAATILQQVRLALGTSALKAVMRARRQLDREEEADVHGMSGDFLVWHSPS